MSIASTEDRQELHIEPEVSMALDAEMAAQYAESEDEAGRVWAASFEHAADAVLDGLSLDSNSDVRLAVARNPNTPDDVLVRMAARPGELYGIRQAAQITRAKSLGISERGLIALVRDEDKVVRQAALLRLARRPGLNAGRSRIRRLVAAHKDAPAEALEAIAKSGDVGVRVRVAIHNSTPVAVLEELARDREGNVRLAVACNSSAPRSVVAAVAAYDRSQHVRRTAKAASIQREMAEEDSTVRTGISP